MTQTLRIDPEFKAQIPPLTQEERKQLEENILAEGELLAPILVWNGTIVDGHNRYEILQSHPEIPCSVRNLELETRDEVLAWICKHQLGRRNLTPEQKKFLMGKQYEAEKQADGFHGNQHTRPVPSAGAQNEHQQTAEKTCERIARENHISASAVRRAALFAAGVDLAEELCPGIRQRVLSGDLKAPDALFERLARCFYPAGGKRLARAAYLVKKEPQRRYAPPAGSAGKGHRKPRCAKQSRLCLGRDGPDSAWRGLLSKRR